VNPFDRKDGMQLDAASRSTDLKMFQTEESDTRHTDDDSSKIA
jgi:hypothetical protein